VNHKVDEELVRALLAVSPENSPPLLIELIIDDVRERGATTCLICGANLRHHVLRALRERVSLEHQENHRDGSRKTCRKNADIRGSRLGRSNGHVQNHHIPDAAQHSGGQRLSQPRNSQRT